MIQVAVITFKQKPDRRFRIRPAPGRLCGDISGYTRCAFFSKACDALHDGAVFDICRHGFYFEEIKE